MLPPPPPSRLSPLGKIKNSTLRLRGKQQGEGAAQEQKRLSQQLRGAVRRPAGRQKTTSRFQTGKRSGSRHSNGKFTGKVQTRSREEHLTQGTNPSLGWDPALTVELGRRQEDENEEKGEQRARRRYETPTDGSAGTLSSHVLAGFQDEWNLSS